MEFNRIELNKIRRLKKKIENRSKKIEERIEIEKIGRKGMLKKVDKEKKSKMDGEKLKRRSGKMESERKRKKILKIIKCERKNKNIKKN